MSSVCVCYLGGTPFEFKKIAGYTEGVQLRGEIILRLW